MFSATAAALAIPLSGIAEAPRLIMHYGDNLNPLSFETGDRMNGLLVDLMNAILRDRMGYDVVHQGFPWARAQQLVREGAGDGFCTNPTAPRREYAFFSATPALTIDFELFYNRDNPEREIIESVNSLEDIRNLSIVDYKGNNLARSIYPRSYDVLWANSPENIIRTLAEGRRDIYIGNPLYAMRIIREQGLEDTIARKPVSIMPPTRYHLGIRKSYPHARAVLAHFDLEMAEARKQGVVHDIRQRYY